MSVRSPTFSCTHHQVHIVYSPESGEWNPSIFVCFQVYKMGETGGDSLLASLLEHFSSKTELFRNRRIQLLQLPHLASPSNAVEAGWMNRPDVWLLTSAPHKLFTAWNFRKFTRFNNSLSHSTADENCHLWVHRKGSQRVVVAHSRQWPLNISIKYPWIRCTNASQFVVTPLSTLQDALNGFFIYFGQFNRCFSRVEIYPTICTTVTEVSRIKTHSTSWV